MGRDATYLDSFLFLECDPFRTKMDQIPLLCALAGIVIVSNRMNGLGTIAGIVGLIAMVFVQERSRTHRPCACPVCVGPIVPTERYEEEPLPPPTPAKSTTTTKDDQVVEEPTTSDPNEPVEPPAPPEEPSAIMMMVCDDGEYVSEHTVIGFPRRPPGITTMVSPNAQLLERQRLPIMLSTETAQKRRLRRVAGTNAMYRSTTGQTSSFIEVRSAGRYRPPFAHLR